MVRSENADVRSHPQIKGQLMSATDSNWNCCTTIRQLGVKRQRDGLMCVNFVEPHRSNECRAETRERCER